MADLMSQFRTSGVLWLQGGVLGAAAIAVAAPPSAGPLLLVPVTDAAASTLVADAVAGGARLIGPGPLPDSLVVAGARKEVARTLGRGVLVLAAPPSGCST
jgi:hypothetical protein